MTHVHCDKFLNNINLKLRIVNSSSLHNGAFYKDDFVRTDKDVRIRRSVRGFLKIRLAFFNQIPFVIPTPLGHSA
jgi:hypothetical protein